MNSVSAKTDLIIVGTSELASIFGRTPRWVNQQTSEGVFQQHERGKYDLAKNVQLFIAHVQDRAEKVAQGGEGPVDYFTERAHHEKAKREKAELELAVMKGELHRAEDIQSVMTDMLSAFRAKILGLPSKMAPQLIAKTDMAVVTDLLTTQLHEALAELANYDPQLFNAKNTEYIELIEDDDDSG